MFAYIFIGYCCSLILVFGTPLNSAYSIDTTQSRTAGSLPYVDLPNSIAEKSRYEFEGGGFEGDMIFSDGFDPRSLKRKGVAKFGNVRWPNSVIPYDISAITAPARRGIILNAIQTLTYAVGTLISGQATRRSCISFRPRQAQDKSYVKFVYGDGCSATVGYRPNNISTLTLKDPNCFFSGTIQHELMHILDACFKNDCQKGVLKTVRQMSFFHEQSRPDRDSFITVNYNNVIPDKKHNFDKLQWGVSALNQNKPYDYGSIMHYPSIAFSANNKPTIVPKKSNVVIGQRDALSANDIAEIRALYQC